MNYKRYVLLFNIFFLLILIAATLLFEWKPGFAGPNFRPLDILSDVLKDSTRQHNLVKGKINNRNGNYTNGKAVLRDYTTYQGLINNSNHPTALSDFFSHLLELKQKKRRKIRIGYFGDSIVEGDLVTEDLRRMLQVYFGGSNVGFVPITSIVAGFRQSVTHSFSSNWEDINYKSDNKAAGDLFISGHSFFSGNNSVVTYRTVNKPGLDSFSNVTVLFGSPADSSDAFANIVVNETPYPVKAVHPFNKLELRSNNAKEVKISITSTAIPLYGAAFEGDSGIVLDNFSFRGISGVELNYFTEDYLKQVQALRPYDLLIFHYGPNLLYDANETDFSWYTKKMQPTLQKIKNAFPGTSFLLISTADKAYKYSGTWRTQKGVLPLIDDQYTMAKNIGADFFNLYNAMGGEDAMVRWVNADTALAGKDYTHPNRVGAKKFAEFIFNAIMKEYQEYEKLNNK
jgi:hypothetical protein